jgi:hypothetical protein
MSRDSETSYFRDLSELQGPKQAYLTGFKQAALASLTYKPKRIR